MSGHLLAAYVLLILKKENSILLIRRSAENKFAPNHFSMPGGRVEANESFTTALIREVKEELSITINQADLSFAHAFYKKGAENEFAAFVFECSKWTGDIQNCEPLKHSELKWVDINHLPEPMIPTHKSVLAFIKEKQLYSEQSPGKLSGFILN